MLLLVAGGPVTRWELIRVKRLRACVYRRQRARAPWRERQAAPPDRTTRRTGWVAGARAISLTALQVQGFFKFRLRLTDDSSDANLVGLKANLFVDESGRRVGGSGE